MEPDRPVEDPATGTGRMSRAALTLRKAWFLARQEGVGSFLRRVPDRCVKPLRMRLDYARRSRDVPQNVIFIAGLAKSGSTWIADMAADVTGFETSVPAGWVRRLTQSWDDFSMTDLYPGLFDGYRRRLAVIKGHTWGTPANAAALREAGLKYLVTVRDPRDRLISAYHYHRNFPEHWDHRHAGSMSLPDFITYKLESGEMKKQDIDWLAGWLDHHDPERARIVRYEDMLEDPAGGLLEAMRFLGFPVTREACEATAARFSFAAQTGRNPGEEDTRSFRRKGVSGEWREVFTEAHRRLFREVGEAVTLRLGYPPTEP